MSTRTETCQYRSAHRLFMHVRLGRLTHANPAFCRKQLLVRRMLVSTRMFIVFMGTVNCSYRKYWHPSVSFVIIINKQVPVTERGTLSYITGYKNDPQSISLLLLLFLHLAYLLHLLTSPHCSKEARQAVAGRGNFSFAAVVNISYKHLQLSVCSVSSLLCFLICSLIVFLALLLVHLLLPILKMVDTTQWANNKLTATESSI